MVEFFRVRSPPVRVDRSAGNGLQSIVYTHMHSTEKLSRGTVEPRSPRICTETTSPVRTPGEIRVGGERQATQNWNRRPVAQGIDARHFIFLAGAKPTNWLAKPTFWLASRLAGRGRVMQPKSTPTPETSQFARTQASLASQKVNSRGRDLRQVQGPTFFLKKRRKTIGRAGRMARARMNELSLLTAGAPQVQPVCARRVRVATAVRISKERADSVKQVAKKEKENRNAPQLMPPNRAPSGAGPFPLGI
ncbi:hypothetical protein C8R47DRAFT_1068214 [Mycena vitilis]|nr:hypothetical protein C8R47DRAFT_1068214 [Mycena vitilis]